MSGTAEPVQPKRRDGNAAIDTQVAWQALLERIPYARHLGLEILQDPTGVQLHLPYRQALIGNIMLPALHGGVLGALVEVTARVAAQSQRSARAQSTFAGAEIVRQGRRTSLVRVICWQDRVSAPVADGRVQLLFETARDGGNREEHNDA
jgi:acyl-coenzyme A thioesterase PaaI-like protein